MYVQQCEYILWHVFTGRWGRVSTGHWPTWCQMQWSITSNYPLVATIWWSTLLCLALLLEAWEANCNRFTSSGPDGDCTHVMMWAYFVKCVINITERGARWSVGREGQPIRDERVSAEHWALWEEAGCTVQSRLMCNEACGDARSLCSAPDLASPVSQHLLILSLMQQRECLVSYNFCI